MLPIALRDRLSVVIKENINLSDMKNNGLSQAIFILISLTMICLFAGSCISKINKKSVPVRSIGNDQTLHQLSYKEKNGSHDNLHYLSNYLVQKTDTLKIRYGYDLCLCPKWYIAFTNEPIWIESSKDGGVSNYSDNDDMGKVIKVIGQFYKYQGVPTDLYDYQYLSEKDVPNARIFKLEKIIK
jgi:hypothetical protein